MLRRLALCCAVLFLAGCSKGPLVDRTLTTRDQDSRVKYLILHYTVNDTASLNGNAVLSINQKGQLACCHGAQFDMNISNGENGVNSTEGGANTDIPNTMPANCTN